MKVSIVVPAYNCDRLISKALESVRSQTFSNYEIIIVDDGSTDNIFDVLETYIADGTIRYYRQDNSGPAAARNRGIREAQGEYIAFLDADDEWLPDHLEQSILFINKGNFDWVASGYYKQWPDGKREYRTFPENSSMFDRITGKVTLLSNGLFYFSSAPIQTLTLLFRKHILQHLKGFDESFRIGEDSDLYIRAEEAGYSCGFLDVPSAIYIHNPSSITKNKRFDGIAEHMRLAKKHAEILGINNDIIRCSYANFIWQSARDYWYQGEYMKALRCMVESQKLNFNISFILSPIINKLLRK